MMEKVSSNNNLVPQLESRAQQKPGKGKAESGAFSSDLAQAQAAGAMAASQSVQPMQQSVGGMNGGSAKAGEKEGAEALRSNLTVSNLAERAPQTQEKAVSLNTASAIAGLKPWSKDWVFPEKGMSPELQPLIGPKESGAAGAEAGLAQLAAQLEGLGLEAKAAQAAAQSGQPLQAAGQRGDAEAAMAAVSAQNAGTAGASAAAANGDSTSQLQQQLQQMGGSIDRVNVLGGTQINNDNGKEIGAPKDRMAKAGGAASSLSGSEFLTTLAAVRGAQGREGGESNLGQQGQQGGAMGGKLGATKPSLRLIEGGNELGGNRDFGESMTSAIASPLAQQSPSSAAVAEAPTEVAGHVVKGRMSQDRLSSEALIGISSGIRNMSTAGGGEMRIRLKPENLGELHVRVVTNGRNVGLQIQASDDAAKKVLEESISHLRENLSVQNLTLSSVDVTVAQAAGKSPGSDLNGQNQGQNQQGQHVFQDMLGHNQGQNHSGGSNRWESDSNSASPLRSGQVSRMSSVSTDSRASAANGRLDVRA